MALQLVEGLLIIGVDGLRLLHAPEHELGVLVVLVVPLLEHVGVE